MLSHPSSRSALARRAGLTGVLLVAALALAGCARDRAPQTYGWSSATQASIKDPVRNSWAPVVKPVMKKEPPAAAKTVHTEPPRAPERTLPAEPRAPEAPRAPAQVDTPRAPTGAPLDCGTDAACLAQLKALIDDPQRAWVGTPQTAAEYVQGIRLFAYRALRSKLTCGEIKSALAQIEAASRSLDAPQPAVTPAQVARVRALGAQVEGELRVQQAGRCTS